MVKVSRLSRWESLETGGPAAKDGQAQSHDSSQRNPSMRVCVHISVCACVSTMTSCHQSPGCRWGLTGRGAAEEQCFHFSSSSDAVPGRGEGGERKGSGRGHSLNGRCGCFCCAPLGQGFLGCCCCCCCRRRRRCCCCIFLAAAQKLSFNLCGYFHGFVFVELQFLFERPHVTTAPTSRSLPGMNNHPTKKKNHRSSDREQHG